MRKFDVKEIWPIYRDLNLAILQQQHIGGGGVWKAETL